MKNNKNQEYAQANLDFLQENAKNPDVKVLPCGVQYRVLTQGTGKKPTLASVVQVYYKGKMTDGRQFDSNLGDKVPAAFRLRDLIEGWQRAIVEMPVGSKWEIFIPASLGYGAQSAGIIRKNSTLIFEIELVAMA